MKRKLTRRIKPSAKKPISLVLLQPKMKVTGKCSLEHVTACDLRNLSLQLLNLFLYYQGQRKAVIENILEAERTFIEVLSPLVAVNSTSNRLSYLIGNMLKSSNMQTVV